MGYKKTLIVSLLVLVMASFAFVGLGKVIPSFPNLPSKPVYLTLYEFEDADNYDVISVLSGVPKGYDVTNGAYTGWCVDYRGWVSPDNDRVYLYSSLNVPNIEPLTSKDWNRINYILNNVNPDATTRDIQEAIWMFCANSFVTYRPIALAMVADANANGENFVPTEGQIVAVICFPPAWDTEENLQITIIELLIFYPDCGKVTGGGQCITADSSEIPAASFGFNAMWFSRDPAPKGELNYIDHTTGMHVHIHIMTYLEVWEPLPGNKPMPLMKAIFGGPCIVNGVKDVYFADVYVEDHGEPGTDDVFQITLGGTGIYNGYVGGTDTAPILAGNIQIHKPPK